MKCSYKSLFDLSGKTALVTGGAGILGRHFCAGLADFGANVVVADCNRLAAQALAGELAETFGVLAIAYEVDVSDAECIGGMISDIETNIGPIDILHNNAATKGSDLRRFFDRAEDFSPDAWRAIMAGNLDGMFFVAREVGNRMAQRGRGSIIQTASIYGAVAPDQRIYEGSEYMGREINTPAVYSASKAGVIGLTKYFSTYWADRGVRVNTLTPGGVESGQNDTFRQRYSARVPLGRMGRPDEMVGALIFLASDASSYITGQNLIVDGGLTVW